ncbi:MAG: bifunctional PIG-L family deacetylase/class I SAM-dependent methyltransferase [Ornithinimicrobium sp.]|uniref:bifunctional PIG-L family deacetylase/class I SAM-dependent methyltransferase n=1 Tax=Ornithinimicrobium sp. TaxID=1977084 RepID=UPI003D9AB6F2
MSAPGRTVATPAFDHREDGTPEKMWRALPEWSRLPVLGLPAHIRRLVVVSAHPDDETLAAAGLLCLAAAAGLDIDLVVATDGAASHPLSSTHRPQDLARIRAREVREALEMLAPEAGLHLLERPDGNLGSHVDPVVERVVELIGTDGEHTLLVSTWEGDRHPDHVAAARVASASAWRTDATLWQAPIWAWSWGGPLDLPWDSAVLVELPVAVHRAKLAAIAHHLSQVSDLSDRPGDEALLGPAFLEHFSREVEFYVRCDPQEVTPFDGLYAVDDDPWQVRSSWYEERKRALTVAALPDRTYPRAIEVGCSLGALSAELAPRCDALLAVDESAVVVSRAREALAEHPHVDVARLQLPEQWPPGWFDLVVISETGYFLSPARLTRLADRVRAGLSDHGVVLACHWRHDVRGWPLTGPAVHERLEEVLGLHRLVQHHEPDFDIVVWTAQGRTDPGT